MNITEPEIREFLRRYEESTNTHIFSKVSDFIHPEAIYRFTDGDFIGIDAIQTAFESTWNSIKNETYTLSEVKVVTTDTMSASVTYEFKWSGIVDGESKSGKGRGTNIIVRDGDNFQFIYEHLSK